MDDIEVIQGEIFKDHRGTIASLNKFHFDGVRRAYIIHHPDISVVRGWHAHKDERKWFYCVKGKFSVALVKIDNWENPSPDLKPDIYHLTENDSKIVCVPKGYANCLKAHTKDAVMLVLSDKILPDAYADSWRYDAGMWVNWNDNIPES